LGSDELPFEDFLFFEVDTDLLPAFFSVLDFTVLDFSDRYFSVFVLSEVFSVFVFSPLPVRLFCAAASKGANAKSAAAAMIAIVRNVVFMIIFFLCQLYNQ
jgi:hypothetical protein